MGRPRGLLRAPGGLPLPDTPLTLGSGIPHAPPQRCAQSLGAPAAEGPGVGGNAPPPARGLALAHPSRPGRAARGLAGPRGCSWALLETSNAGSDSSPTARMQEPPLPPPCTPTPPPSAEPQRRGRASRRQSQRGSEQGAGGGQGCSVVLHCLRARGQTHGRVPRGALRAPAGGGLLARWGWGSETHKYPNSDSHSQLTRGQGDKDTHGAQETRGALTASPWKYAGGPSSAAGTGATDHCGAHRHRAASEPSGSSRTH